VARARQKVPKRASSEGKKKLRYKLIQKGETTVTSKPRRGDSAGARKPIWRHLSGTPVRKRNTL